MTTTSAAVRGLGRATLHVGSFGITLLIWTGIAHAQLDAATSALLIVGGMVLVVPVVLLARRLLDRDPSPGRTATITFFLHWLLMILLGAAIIEAIWTGRNWRGWTLPVSPRIGLVLLWITGIAALLTVLNLAVRGLGAPFAIALSRRLATDWLYRRTRNPMVLATLAFLAAYGLYIQSALFLAWVLLLATPAWLVFLKVYEERELELRFGASYLAYKARTPMLIPGRLRAPHAEEAGAEVAGSGAER